MRFAGRGVVLHHPARIGGGVGGFIHAQAAKAPPLAAIHERLKRQFDPAGILNRGRLYPKL